MKGTSPHALPPFLHFLSSFPAPATVARALVVGPLAPLGARSCIVMLAHDDELRLLSTHGVLEAADDRYRTISLRLDLSIIDAFRQSRIIVSDLETFCDAYPSLMLDRDLWTALEGAVGPGTVVDAPILSEGVPIGCIGLVCSGQEPWSPDGFALLDGICSALGMWITHPRSRIQRTLNPRRGTSEMRLELTPRQREILRLVEKDKSNAMIAASLGFSDSTVKQELLRIMRLLRVTDRHQAVRTAREVGLIP
jgi:DNA-binding CsgD family transcriptional regulator